MRCPRLLFAALSLGCSLSASTIRDSDAGQISDTARDLVAADHPARDVTDAARTDTNARDVPANADTPLDAVCGSPAPLRCGAVCVDPMLDPRNCGACGNECCAGQVCSGGRCSYVCNPGALACTRPGERCGFCVDPSTDRAHCGGCDNACPMGRDCIAGRCTAACASCPTGRTCCGTACVNTATDASHCGACGRVCCADTSCVDGTCQVACVSGMTACPVTLMSCEGSVCTNLNNDVMNCGRCGNRCDAPRTCISGNCRVG